MPQQYFYPEHKLKNSSNQASILLVCLWTIIILAIMGMGLTSLVFQEIRFAKAYQRSSFSLPIARAALKTVFYLRQNDPSPDYDTFQELVSENSLTLCANNSYKYYFVDKTKTIDQNSTDKTEIIDEGALINLNTASLDVLKRLPGMDEELAQGIVNSGLRPFSCVNEVFLVEGMNSENFLLFKDLVTVYGTGKININTASPAVLLALGLDKDTVAAIVRFRQEHKIVNTDPASTEDLGYGFSNITTILDDLRSFASLGLRQEQDILALLSVLDVKSEYLRFNIIPDSSGRQGLHYSIVICPATKKILSWKEY
jgi:DNA uptake protein ComE-like DNA-binding protein